MKNMTYKFSFLTAILLMFSINLKADVVTYIWDYDYLTDMKNGEYQSERNDIINEAAKIKTRKKVAVTQKKKTISGDIHNYESLSIYYWPDEKNPNGPYVVKDGQYNPEYKEYDLPRLLEMAGNLKYSALAYFLTQNQEYYDDFCEQIDVWFINSDTRMNPNFEYSQFAPGQDNNKGKPGGMIDASNFNEVLESIRLVNSVNDLGKKRNKLLVRWFSDFAKWMQKSDYGKKAAAFKNNQGINYDYTLYNILIFTGDKKERTDLWNSFYSNRVMTQIGDDGKQQEELKRTKAFFYSIYNLGFICDYCLLAKNDGMDVSLVSNKAEKAADYLSQFIGNKSKFPYKEIGNWETEEKDLKEKISIIKKIKPNTTAFDKINLSGIKYSGL